MFVIAFSVVSTARVIQDCALMYPNISYFVDVVSLRDTRPHEPRGRGAAETLGNFCNLSAAERNKDGIFCATRYAPESYLSVSTYSPSSDHKDPDCARFAPWCALVELRHYLRSVVCQFLLGFEQSLADACVMRLVESGIVSIVTVVHMDDIFAVGHKARFDQLCEDLNRLVPINNLGELRWYADCRYSRDWDAGSLTISQQAFPENKALGLGVSSGRKNPLAKGL